MNAVSPLQHVDSAEDTGSFQLLNHAVDTTNQTAPPYLFKPRREAQLRPAP